ncbi:ABC transporter permease [Nitriliruptor alkaliphilus]|uniref:ABC transporter permease n=1 Tax=Nitriliruptor alkaliphilus TaxID=427918 RepID=UPI000697051A|nr:ABC transporter permease [Nitriliruptor alkaliphilus]
MEPIIDALRFLADWSNWTGSRGVLVRLVEHIQVSLPPLIAAMLVAIPAGVLAGHHRRGQAIGTAIANVGRAIPTLALLVFGLILSVRVLGLGISYWPTVFALFFLALHPLFTNSYTAVKNVDRVLVEAARGMGYDDRQLLREVELPVASPVIFTAIRIAAVQVVATAPIGALAAGGGFGRFVIDGFGSRNYGVMYAGIILIALLAVATERLIDGIERLVVPKGLRARADDDVVTVTAATGRAV